MISVFSASAAPARSRTSSSADPQQAQQEVGLIEKPERRQPFGFGRGAHAGEVDVRGDVLLARLLEPRRRVRRSPGPPLVWRANVVSVPAECVAE